MFNHETPMKPPFARLTALLATTNQAQRQAIERLDLMAWVHHHGRALKLIQLQINLLKK